MLATVFNPFTVQPERDADKLLDIVHRTFYMLNIVMCSAKVKNTCFCTFVSFLHRLILYCKSVSKLLQENVSCIICLI